MHNEFDLSFFPNYKPQSTAYDLLKIGRDHNFYVANQLDKKLHTISASTDMTLHFQLNSDGTEPMWVSLLKDTINNSKMGTMYAVQNRLNMQRLLDGLSKETAKLLKQSNSVSMHQVLNTALINLGNHAMYGQIFTDFVEQYDMQSIRARHVSAIGGRFTPNAFKGGTQGVHERITNNLVGKVRIQELPDGEVVYGVSDTIGNPTAKDADGDQATLLTMFKNKHTGKTHYALDSKAPDLLRSGYYVVEAPQSPLEILEQVGNGFMPTVPGQEGSSLEHLQEIYETEPQNLFEKLQQAKDERLLIQHYLSGGMYSEGQEHIMGNTAALLTKHVEKMKEMLVGPQSIIGLETNKMVDFELFNMLDDINNMNFNSLSEMQIAIDARLNLGTQRLDVLEKGALKATSGRSKFSAIDQRYKDFSMRLTSSASTLIRDSKNFQDLERYTPDQLVGSILKGAGIDPSTLSREDSMHVAQLTEYFLNPLATIVTAGKKSFEYKPAFDPNYLRRNNITAFRGPNKNSKAVSNVKLLEELGFLKFAPILVPKDQRYDHAFEHQGKMYNLSSVQQQYAILFNTHLNEENIIGTSTPLTEEGFTNTGILRGSVIANAENRSIQLLEARQAAVNYLSNTLNFNFNFLGQEFELGNAGGLFSRENLRKRTTQDSIINTFIKNDADIQLTKLPITSSINQRKEALRNYIGLMLTKDDATFQKFVAQLQLQTPSGQAFQRSVSKHLDELISIIGTTGTVSYGNGIAAYSSKQVAAVNSQTVNLISGSREASLEHFATDLVYGQTIANLSTNVHEPKGGRAVVVEIADAAGRQRRMAGDVTAASKRVTKIRSQINNSIPIENARVAYTEIDLLEQFLQFEDHLLTPGQIRSKYFAERNEDEVVTARSNRFGANQSLASAKMGQNFKEAVSRNKLFEINLPESITPSEAEEMGAKPVVTFRGGKMKVTYKINLDDYENLRAYTKIVSDMGDIKIEQTNIADSILDHTGQEIDFVMFGGELSQKREVMDLGINLYSKAAGELGYSEEKTMSGISAFTSKMRDIREERAAALEAGIELGEVDRITKAKIREAQEEFLGEVGISIGQIQVTHGGETKTIDAMIRQQTLMGVVNSAEIKRDLGEPNNLNLMTEYGRRSKDNLTTNLSNLIADIYGVDREGIQSAVKTEVERIIGESVDTKGFDNAFVLNQVIEALNMSAPTGGSNFVDPGMGARRAASEFIGGPAMTANVEHMARMTQQARTGAFVGGSMLIGAALLDRFNNNRKDRRSNR